MAFAQNRMAASRSRERCSSSTPRLTCASAYLPPTAASAATNLALAPESRVEGMIRTTGSSRLSVSVGRGVSGRVVAGLVVGCVWWWGLVGGGVWLGGGLWLGVCVGGVVVGELVVVGLGFGGLGGLVAASVAHIAHALDPTPPHPMRWAGPAIRRGPPSRSEFRRAS